MGAKDTQGKNYEGMVWYKGMKSREGRGNKRGVGRRTTNTSLDSR